MQCDETIWTVCGHSFCAAKAKFQDVTLCRNIYNVTGQCTRTSCPLANSYYGTILEENGVCFLYLKTIERAHTPRKLWEKIRLNANTEKAIAQIEAHMTNIYKDQQIKKCKLRLQRIRQYLSRMRQIALKPAVNLVNETRKLTRRETNREVKALRAARITDAVQEELVSRLKAGHYGEIYNYPRQTFNDIVEEDSESESSEEDDEEQVERGIAEISDDDLEVDDLEDMIEA